MGVVGETLAAEVGFAEPLALDHDAPGAVEHQDALARRRRQRLESPRARRRTHDACSRTPSTRQMA